MSININTLPEYVISLVIMDSALPLKGYCDLVNSEKKMYTPGCYHIFLAKFSSNRRLWLSRSGSRVGCLSTGRLMAWIPHSACWCILWQDIDPWVAPDPSVCVQMLAKMPRYRKKCLHECVSDWLTEACSKKQSECSVIVEKHYISTIYRLCH